MTEFDGQDVDYSGDAGYESDAYAGGPDLSDGIGQMQAAYQPGAEVPAPAYGDGYDESGFAQEPGLPDDGYYDEGFADEGFADEGYEPEMSEADVVAELVDGRVREQMQPVLEAVSWDRRVREVQALADEFPQLRDPETMEAIEGELDELASVYGDAARSDPRLVRQALLAHEAEQAMTAEQRRLAQAEQQQQQPRGLVLETGAGPGPASSQVDEVEAAYTRALAGKQADPYGFPVSP